MSTNSAAFAQFAPLFAPFSIGALGIANRFVMAPMTRSRSPEGVPSAAVADYYARRAIGGVGLIITEGVGVDHPAALGVSDFDGEAIPVLHGAAALEGWRRVVNAVHAAGGKIAPQLWHQGVMRPAGTGRFPEYPSSRPSGVWGPADGNCSIPLATREKLLPKSAPLTENEISDIIAAFARSALHAKAVGFDAIALHGAHGYLLDTFLWSETNFRTDGYGGDPLRRTRFVCEVVRAVRAAIGSSMPILFRFSQWKQQDFDAKLAHTPHELEVVLGPLVEAGVDVFDVSTRRFDVAAFEGSAMSLAGWARKLTGKPSITVGGVGLDRDLHTSIQSGGSQPVPLDSVLERFNRGEFDLVALGRSLIADSAWVQKLSRGEPHVAFNPAMLGQLY